MANTRMAARRASPPKVASKPSLNPGDILYLALVMHFAGYGDIVDEDGTVSGEKLIGALTDFSNSRLNDERSVDIVVLTLKKLGLNDRLEASGVVGADAKKAAETARDIVVRMHQHQHPPRRTATMRG